MGDSCIAAVLCITACIFLVQICIHLAVIENQNNKTLDTRVGHVYLEVLACIFRHSNCSTVRPQVPLREEKNVPGLPP
jgi:hypothetical protein